MSTEDERRAQEIRDIEGRVTRLVGTATAAQWMDRPIEPLQGRTPSEAIAAGDYLAVSRLVGGLDEMPVA